MKLRGPSLVLALLLPMISVGQEQTTNRLLQRKGIDWFYADADSRPKNLLLKLLQFQAPYPGYYQQAVIASDGFAFTARNVPDCAVQNSAHAKLNPAVMAPVKQVLGQLSVPATAPAPKPQTGQLHSAFVFYDGHDYLRLNYHGPNPVQIDAIVAILREAFTTAERTREEETAAHQ